MNEPTPVQTQNTQVQAKTVEIKTESLTSGGPWTFLKNGNLQIFITLVTVAIALFNLWISSKLAPVAQDIANVANTVKAMDGRVSTLESSTNLYLPRYIATEQQVAGMSASIARIEAAQIRSDQKLDTLILRNSN